MQATEATRAREPSTRLAFIRKIRPSFTYIDALKSSLEEQQNRTEQNRTEQSNRTDSNTIIHTIVDVLPPTSSASRDASETPPEHLRNNNFPLTQVIPPNLFSY